MATVEECRAALERLAARLAAVDGRRAANTSFDRTLSCHVPDLDVTFTGALRGRPHTGITTDPAPKAQVRLTVDSDDLVALTDGQLTSARPGCRPGQGRGQHPRPAQAPVHALTTPAGSAVRRPSTAAATLSASTPPRLRPRTRRTARAVRRCRPRPIDAPRRPSRRDRRSRRTSSRRPAPDRRVRRRAARSRSAAMYVGRSAAAARSTSAGVATPVSTSRLAHAGPVGALDVGVQPVADHQRALGAGAPHRLLVQRELRLAGDRVGVAAGGCATTPTSAPLPGASPRAVGMVRRGWTATQAAPRRTANVPSASSCPADVGREALHDGSGLVVGRRHRRAARARSAPRAAPRRRRPAPARRPAPRRRAAWRRPARR